MPFSAPHGPQNIRGVLDADRLWRKAGGLVVLKCCKLPFADERAV